MVGRECGCLGRVAPRAKAGTPRAGEAARHIMTRDACIFAGNLTGETVFFTGRGPSHAQEMQLWKCQ